MSWNDKPLQFISIILILIVASACQTVAGTDNLPTLSYNMTAFATEAVSLQQTLQADQTQVLATVEAGETHVAEVSAVNSILLATAQVGETPVIEVRPVVIEPSTSNFADNMDEMEFTEGEMRIVGVATAPNVRNSDGCPDRQQFFFQPTASRVYLTAQAFNLSAGTQLAVNWDFDEELVYRSLWTVPNDMPAECIWFYIEPTDAPFLPGDWMATLYVDGTLVNAIAFTMGAESGG